MLEEDSMRSELNASTDRPAAEILLRRCSTNAKNRIIPLIIVVKIKYPFMIYKLLGPLKGRNPTIL